ncbi:RelA/SpoT domain-containing protein [Falsarthrobacter nasiphocae]|uniref:PpGpp synthetase/RelA/SpoT-type nucleotidyltransferase n=1 Tax=Falsarthrobacter nasiphocae TaxID=189863 RepID=A0AAE4C6C6_9MICC|nr:RelA/SpoT domain-containing protein [Falsarthrobacter nasiphocae]MDR6892012.1 ppGpp synthetase/RelA/SpoT-type nucleotidyltransferase [Falsarthrobacter nasiphocae]
MRQRRHLSATGHDHTTSAELARSVRASVEEYIRLRPALEAVTADVTEKITQIFEGSTVRPLFIASRTKSVESFEEKASRVLPAMDEDETETLIFPDPLKNLNDLVAVRVIVTLPHEIREAAGLIKRARDIFDCRGDKEKDTGSIESGTYGYSSRHLILRTLQNDAVRHYQSLLPDADPNPNGAYFFEVQIRTVFAHAWSEIEHDIRFKSADRRAWSPTFDRQFTATAAMLEKVEETFEDLNDAYTRVSEFWDPEYGGAVPLTPARIREVWETLLPHVDRKFDDDWGWAAELLAAHEVERTDRLCELLDANRIRHVRSALDHRYSPGPDRLLDDVLLWEFGQGHIDRTAPEGDDELRSRRASLSRRLRQMRTYRRLHPEDFPPPLAREAESGA